MLLVPLLCLSSANPLATQDPGSTTPGVAAGPEANLVRSVQREAQSPVGGPSLYVQGPDGVEWAALLFPGNSRVLLPARTLSERVTRAIPDRGRMELQIGQTGWRAVQDLHMTPRVLRHPTGTRLMVFGEELRLLREEQLPTDILGGPADPSYLGALARQDGLGVRERIVHISAGPVGSDLVLIPVDEGPSVWHMEARQPGMPWESLQLNQLQGHALRLEGTSAWDLKLGPIALDQVFHARTEAFAPGADPLTPESQRCVMNTERNLHPKHGWGEHRPYLKPLDRGAANWDANDPERSLSAGQLLRMRYPIREGQEQDQTWTLLVDVHFQLTEESAPVEPDSAPAPPYFRDVAEVAGLFDVHFEGPALQLDIRPTMGPGAAWGDVDGDGMPDLYLVQGAGREGSQAPTNRLLHNNGDGSFSPMAGAPDTGAGMGALFFDLDGDGDLDLYVANYGPDKLYRNDGAGNLEDLTQGTAQEVAPAQQLASEGWSAGLCAADYDRDGDLDLYVTSYLVYDTALMPPVEQLPGYAREDPTEMLPFAFPGAKNHFLENVNGQLVDRTEALGLVDEQGRGMQAVFWDFDLDGDQDLYVANDVSFNVLYRNEGDGTFKDISFQVGMDDPRGGMGVATGDVDADGDADLFLTNWELEANALYRNNVVSSRGGKSHTGSFQDVTVHSRLSRDSVGTTSWGAVFFDADNDGDLDLFVPNGYTSPDYESTGICVGQPNQFFLNDGAGRFEDVSGRSGPAVLGEFASRSAALCDYDRDGRLDLLVTNNNGPYQLLRNELPSTGHWIGVQLRGSEQWPSAVGARLELEVDGRVLVRELQAGSGYLAGHADEVHFGLGAAEEVGELRITWPSGATSTHPLGALDRWTVLRHPQDS